MKFSAVDPGDPTAKFFWSIPSEMKYSAQTANEVTLISKSAVGSFELMAVNSSGGSTVGSAEIQVVDYSFDFNIALGYIGVPSHVSLGDVGVVQTSGSTATSRIWVAYINSSSGQLGGKVSLYEHDFKSIVHEWGFPNAVFSPDHRPEIAADAAGVGYWIRLGPNATQFLVRAQEDGSVEERDLASLLAPAGLMPAITTDIAVTSGGDLVFECIDSTTQVRAVYSILDAFGSNPNAKLWCPTASYADVQIEVDALGRLLLADNATFRLLRVTGEGDDASIENLSSFQEPIVDIDEDQQSAIYVTARTRVVVLDAEGDSVFEIEDADVLDKNGNHVVIQFESLLGTGIDQEGNLRLIDDPSSEVPNLPIGTVATYNFTIDLQ